MNYVPIVTFWIFTYHKIWICQLCSVLYEVIELFIFSPLRSIAADGFIAWRNFLSVRPFVKPGE